MGGHSLEFCEHQTTRDYTTLEKISANTLRTYLDEVTREVEKAIYTVLPDKFIIIGDGWTFDSVYYFALFASFEAMTILLSMSPLISEESKSAAAHYEAIVYNLSLFGKTVTNVTAYVADNENLNKAIAKLLKVPLIGCASHRLALAVKNSFLVDFDDILDKIGTLMVKIKVSNKRSAELRKKTSLHPIIPNKTRWSSQFEMAKRYQEIRKFVPKSDLELVPYLLTDDEDQKVDLLVSDLADIISVTKTLQDEKIDLLEVRFLFDALILKFPALKSHISQDSDIVANKGFENGIMLCLDGKSEKLTDKQIALLKPFKKDVQGNADVDASSFAKRTLEAKRQKIDAVYDLAWVPSTSNVAERLFSRAKLTVGHQRHNLAPSHLETLLFRYINYRFWDAELVSRVVA